MRRTAWTSCRARDEPDPRQAFERLLDHYVHSARQAPPSWFEVEHANLVAVVELADDDRAVDLAVAIGDSPVPRTRWDDRESTYRHALAAGDRLGTAKVLVNLGIAHERVRMVEKAREYWTEARDVFRGFGDSESASHVERWLAELGGQR